MSIKRIKDDLKLAVGYLTNVNKRNHNIGNTGRTVRLFEFIVTFTESYNVLKHYVGSSMGSSVSTVTKLQAGRSAVQIPAAARGEFLLQNSQTYCGAHPWYRSYVPRNIRQALQDTTSVPKDLNLDRPSTVRNVDRNKASGVAVSHNLLSDPADSYK
jgi:hypothetical protein